MVYNDRVQILIDHLVDIAGGFCTLDEAAIMAEEDTQYRELLTGLLFLHEDLRYQRNKNTEMMDDLVRAEAIADQANQAKSIFLATMSHEVRTPLNGIMGTTELLRQTRLTPKQKRYVDTLNHAGSGLLTLLNDVLDMARAEAGKIELLPEPVNLRKLLESMTLLMDAQARKKGIALEYSVAKEVPKTVLVDAVRLRQILLNLLGNAVKFTDSGRIDVTLSCESERNGRHPLEWQVRDTGIGIPAEALKSLFERFAQFDTSSSQRHEGSGLGLSICKDLVELMGGTIGVDSQQGKGSRFHFTLELESVSSPEEGAIDEPHSPDLPPITCDASTKLLIVDDIQLNRDVLAELMVNDGNIVKVASSGQSALDQIEKENFDAVILDIFMPDMDGMAVARGLRKRGKTLPIIGLTAAMESALFRKCLESGMDAVLSKPATPQELNAMISQLTGKPRDTSQVPVLDHTILNRFRTRLGDEKMLEFAKQYEECSTEQICKIRETNSSKEMRLLGDHSHRLSGMSSTLGLVRIGLLAEEISLMARNSHTPFNIDPLLSRLAVLHKESLDALFNAMEMEVAIDQ